MKMLVAAADSRMRFLLDEAVERCGQEVIGPSRSLGEALMLARHCKPDLALVAVEGATGADAQQLTTRLAELSVPSILVTAGSSAELASRDALALIETDGSLDGVTRSIDALRRIASGQSQTATPLPANLTFC